MDFFKRLFAPKRAPEEMWINVQCNRCGEVIRTRVDLRNDLSIDWNEDSGQTYFTRKTLMGEGENHCFQRMEVELTFDQGRNLVNRTVSGGKFVDA
ncbi:MAG TPA: hypothetical protein VLS48_05095 [Anaerolineales bacterium]|nr:hypothetical protein [Anaerolineales bacterium]